MHWDDHREDQPPTEDDRDLVAGNLQRIKRLIYGTVDEPPASRRSGHGTSGRKRDT